MLYFEALNTYRRFQCGFDRVNLQRPTLLVAASLALAALAASAFCTEGLSTVIFAVQFDCLLIVYR